MTATTTLSRELKLAIFAGCMISFISFGFSASFSVFLRPMSIELGWGREVFSLSLAIQALMWGITQPLAGMYADKHGSSRVLAFGAVVAALGFALRGSFEDPILFILTGFIVGVGTGGTISGVAKFLKEKNPNIKIWGIDTYGSVFKKYHETGIFDENEIYPYITEGIGEDILPENVDFKLIDKFEKVTDKDAAVFTRKLAQQEGIFAGNSCGAAIKGLLQLKHHFTEDDVIVVLLHDSGSRYIGKIYNDDWMIEKGFMEK